MNYTIKFFEKDDAPKASHMAQAKLDEVPDYIVSRGKLYELRDQESLNLTYVLKPFTVAVVS